MESQHVTQETRNAYFSSIPSSELCGVSYYASQDPRETELFVLAYDNTYVDYGMAVNVAFCNARIIEIDEIESISLPRRVIANYTAKEGDESDFICKLVIKMLFSSHPFILYSCCSSNLQ